MLFILGTSTAAHASNVTWFGPLDPANSNANWPAVNGTFTQNFGVAFTTGSSGPFTISWVNLGLNTSSVTTGAVTLTVALHGATNSTPYSAVAGPTAWATDTITLSMPTTTSTAFTASLTAAQLPNISAYAMSANTSYALILYAPMVNIGMMRTTGYANGTTNDRYITSEGFIALSTLRNNVSNYANSATSYPTLAISFGATAPDSDADGVTDSADLCPATASGAAVDASGCAASQRDTDGDGVTDDLDLCAGTAAGAPVDASGCVPGLAMIITTDLPVADSNCSAGGVKVEIGYDDNNDGMLSSGTEVTNVTYVCDGAAGESAVVTPLPVGDASCPTGGVSVRVGEGAVSDVCNGATGATGDAGAAGADGYTVLLVTDDEVGSNCDDDGAGGLRVRSGLDDGLGSDGETPAGTAHDGLLDDGEVDAVTHVCNGATGADGSRGLTSMVRTVALGDDSEDCDRRGGVVIETGLDENGDGELGPDEVQSSAIICNGGDGVRDLDGDGVDDRLVLSGGCNGADSTPGLLGLAALLGLLTLRRRHS